MYVLSCKIWQKMICLLSHIVTINTILNQSEADDNGKRKKDSESRKRT